MNIYALEGHKVRVKTFDAGHKWQQKKARSLLNIGMTYTVDHTRVYSSSTDVFLKEFEGQSFNSVFFEDFKPQSKEHDMKHPQWNYYNTPRKGMGNSIELPF